MPLPCHPDYKRLSALIQLRGASPRRSFRACPCAQETTQHMLGRQGRRNPQREARAQKIVPEAISFFQQPVKDLQISPDIPIPPVQVVTHGFLFSANSVLLRQGFEYRPKSARHLIWGNLVQVVPFEKINIFLKKGKERNSS